MSDQRLLRGMSRVLFFERGKGSVNATPLLTFRVRLLEGRSVAKWSGENICFSFSGEGAFGENRGFLGFMALGANFCAPEPGRVAKAGGREKNMEM